MNSEIKFYYAEARNMLRFYPEHQTLYAEVELSLDFLKSKCDGVTRGLTILDAIINDDVASYISQLVKCGAILYLNLYNSIVTPMGLNYLLNAINIKRTTVNIEFNRLRCKHSESISPKDFFQGETEIHQEFIKKASEQEVVVDHMTLDWEFDDQISHRVNVSTEELKPSNVKTKRSPPSSKERPAKAQRFQ